VPVVEIARRRLDDVHAALWYSGENGRIQLRNLSGLRADAEHNHPLAIAFARVLSPRKNHWELRDLLDRSL